MYLVGINVKTSAWTCVSCVDCIWIYFGWIPFTLFTKMRPHCDCMTSDFTFLHKISTIKHQNIKTNVLSILLLFTFSLWCDSTSSDALISPECMHVPSFIGMQQRKAAFLGPYITEGCHILYNPPNAEKLMDAARLVCFSRPAISHKIGRASCRERVCQYV